MKPRKLYGLLAGSLALGAGAYFGNQVLRESHEIKQKEAAQEFFSSFPWAENLPGAASVEKYEVNEAKHCLVHIRQSHYGDFPSLVGLNHSIENLERIVAELGEFEGISDIVYETQATIDKNKTFISSLREEVRSDYKEINEVQRDIFCLIQYLQNNRGIKNIYGEGVTEDLSPEDCFYNMQIRFNEMSSKGYVSQDEIIDRDGSFFFVPGADFIFGSGGHVHIRPAETDEGNRLAFEDGDNRFYVFENRENIALSLLALSPEPHTVMIYGGKHDFQDNVEAWNIMHPDNMFSLIVVKPSSYK